ncbi:hypothetical protein AB0B25_01250 [Nocardia sp. NPDC049190]
MTSATDVRCDAPLGAAVGLGALQAAGGFPVDTGSTRTPSR